MFCLGWEWKAALPRHLFLWNLHSRAGIPPEWGSQTARSLPELEFTALNVPGQVRFSGRAGSILPFCGTPRSHIPAAGACSRLCSPAALPSWLENTWEPFCSGRNNSGSARGLRHCQRCHFIPLLGYFCAPAVPPLTFGRTVCILGRGTRGRSSCLEETGSPEF